MNKLFFALLFTCLTTLTFAQNGKIRGQIIDDLNGWPLIGTTVMIEGTTKGTTTDLDGNYSIEGLEAGNYNLVVSYISYETQTITGIELSHGATEVINVRLKESLLELEGTVITAKATKNTESALLTIQRKSSNVIDGVSSETFSRTGDSDAGAAMSRVTGVSVVGGKYVYVRGLGDRYSKTLLNGAEIPGLDPNRNTVQMDLFPTNLIDNIIVYKTFSPNLPGSFTGGLIDVNTKDFPEKFNLQVGTSIGFNTQSSFNSDFLSYDGGKLDWFGFDDGTRDIPDVAQQEFPTQGQAQNGTASGEQLEVVTRSFSNEMTPVNDTKLMNHSHSVSLGSQTKLFGKSLGYIGGFTYSRSFSSYNDGETGRYKLTENIDSAESLLSQLVLDDAKSTENVLWGAMFSANMKLNQMNKVGVMVMRNQSSEKGARYQEGRKPEDDVNLFYQTRSLSFQQRSLSSFQLNGEHVIKNEKGPQLDWTVSYTNSNMQEPDLRFFTNGYRVSNGDTSYSIEPSIGQIPTRFWRELDEKNVDGKAHFTYPFKQWIQMDAKVMTGVSFVYKTREFRELQYAYDNNINSTLDSVNGNPNAFVQEVRDWSSDDTEGVYIVDNSQDRNNYDADQQVMAAYLMIELPITSKLKVVTGARLEKTTLHFTSYSRILQNTKGLNDATLLDNLDVLPAFNLTYEVVKNMNLRLSYGRTLARPTFRELAPFGSFDFVGDFILVGNEQLERTLVDNFDVRWEYFFARGEMVSVSGFFKNFQNPIEKVINPIASNNELNFRNVDQAKVYGVEVEVRKNFKFISEKLENLALGVNVTYVKSVVDINADELEAIRSLDPNADDTREMFGQSPYIANAFLAYSNQESGTRANVNFNIQGQRLAIVMRQGTPNVYELPRPLLGFTFKQRIGEHFDVRFVANNLLNPTYELAHQFKGEDVVYQSYKNGIDFSIGFTYFIK